MTFPTCTTGSIISSTPALQDDHWFGNSRLLITSHNKDGATAFIINKPFHRRFNELQEFSQCPPLTLYTGGPVHNDHLFFLHIRPDLIPGSTTVWGKIHIGGDFGVVTEQLVAGNLPEHEIRVFLGYCGWDKDELEEEIAEGSWIVESNNTAETLYNLYQ